MILRRRRAQTGIEAAQKYASNSEDQHFSSLTLQCVESLHICVCMHFGPHLSEATVEMSLPPNPLFPFLNND